MCPNFGTPKNNKFSILNKINGKFIIFRRPNTKAHYIISGKEAGCLLGLIL